jgi:Na+-driven multidrug efflux pump
LTIGLQVACLVYPIVGMSFSRSASGIALGLSRGVVTLVAEKLGAKRVQGA